ncbi:unnamed protein product [Phytophthora lilii]|uniref:Unnamed protein product n=1 Tax=Phytophthora lilii TaxID=2077276 RepID=A0A9W6WWS7_9STRA|nr:unnamed protein product [Phytophthora lilii]
MPPMTSTAERPHLLVLFILLAWIITVSAASNLAKEMASNAVHIGWDKAGIRRSCSWEMMAKVKQQKTTDKLFKKLEVNSNLKVDEINPKFLESEQFQKWFASAAKTYKKKSDMGDLAMVSTLTRRFSDDAVTSLIVAAKQASTTSTLAKRLEKAQLKYWINEGKQQMTCSNYYTLIRWTIFWVVRC